jgi:hypothetical protein
MPWWRVGLISIQAGLAYGLVTRGSGYWVATGGVLFFITLFQTIKLEGKS